MPEPIPPRLNQITREVISAAIAVHQTLDPGLLESVYEACLAHELRSRGIAFRQQVGLPVIYGEIRLEAGLRLDLLVEELVIIEIKAVDALNPIHDAQLLTYLKLSGRRLGLLINFNVVVLKQGLRRVVL
ncbi:GxxExxY protein [Fimbriimonas ginsengisoli]|uniref:GxxExxY protein n=1 Tax=Fimbriimonas ginsengisoli TaxID=1005039 RepID=UPI00046CAD6B|nr:GxxExxY protein [Fimbriimonas ginsengisoli]